MLGKEQLSIISSKPFTGFSNLELHNYHFKSIRVCTFTIRNRIISTEVETMSAAKINRLDIRISQEDKETLELAAASKRVSLSSYILSAIMEKAMNDLQREREITLSLNAWNQMMDLIDNPPEPNDALRGLANR